MAMAAGQIPVGGHHCAAPAVLGRPLLGGLHQFGPLHAAELVAAAPQRGLQRVGQRVGVAEEGIHGEGPGAAPGVSRPPVAGRWRARRHSDGR